MSPSPVFIEFSGRDEVSAKYLLRKISHQLQDAGFSVEALAKGVEPKELPTYIKVVVND